MRPSRVLAVDVGASHVTCGVFTVGAAGRLVLSHFASESHLSDPSHETRWAVDVAQSLGAISARTKLGGSCLLGVPGHLALVKFIKTPSIAKEKRGKIVAFEAGENIPYPLNEVVWDYAVVADDGFDLEVMLTAAKADVMGGLCTAADSAGFAPGRAVPSALALYHAFQYSYPETRESALVVEVGARSTHLLFIDQGRFYVRTLAIAGNAVTQAIADELRIDFAAAETLKLQVVSGRSDLPAQSPSRVAVHRATVNFVQRLQVEIMRSTVNHRRQSGSGAPAVLYLCGGGSRLAELPALLAEKLRIRVERYEGLRHVDVSANARASGADAAADLLPVLVGLATRALGAPASDASLLPPSLTAAIAFRKRQPRLIAAAVCGVLALLPPIYYLHRLATADQERTAQVEEQLMPLHAVQTRNEDNLRQIEEAKKQIAALSGAFAAKARWIDFLSDVQSRLVEVENVWLDGLHIVRPTPEPAAAEGAAPAAGEATPPTDAATPAPQPLRLNISGRLLDVANPQSKVSGESYARVQALLQKLKQSRFVAAVENERFDNTQNGLLRFDFTVVIKPQTPL